MGFKPVSIMDIYDIIRRWHNRQSITHISVTLGFDRKTVRKYIQCAIEKGFSPDKQFPSQRKDNNSDSRGFHLVPLFRV